MARKQEYPQNTHILARVEALIAPLSLMTGFLRMVRKYFLPLLEGERQEVLAAELARLEQVTALARRALLGDDQE